MKTQTQHTLTPWKRDGTSLYVEIKESMTGSTVPQHFVSVDAPGFGLATQAEKEANAAFIVRAVNAYEELLATLHNLHKQLRGEIGLSEIVKIQDEIKQAIAKAEGKK